MRHFNKEFENVNEHLVCVLHKNDIVVLFDCRSPVSLKYAGQFNVRVNFIIHTDHCVVTLKLNQKDDFIIYIYRNCHVLIITIFFYFFKIHILK